MEVKQGPKRDEQFGRDIVKYYNTCKKASEIQIYFYSDSQEFQFSQLLKVNSFLEMMISVDR